jgi:hypothetical protein
MNRGNARYIIQGIIAAAVIAICFTALARDAGRPSRDIVVCDTCRRGGVIERWQWDWFYAAFAAISAGFIADSVRNVRKR